MGSKQLAETGSPSASSIFLPRVRHRGSVGSINSHVNKEALNQALDDIHSAASQSEALTTFNEFTSPPPASAPGDAKGLTADLQGGLSGLYSRLKATVGTPSKDQAPVSDAIDDASSTKSSKLTSSISNLSSRNVGSRSALVASPAPSPPVMTRDQQAFEQLTESQHSGNSGVTRGDRQRTGTDASISSAPGRLKKPSTGTGRASLGPSTQKIVEPTVAGITVNATKSVHSQNTGSSEIEDQHPPTPTSPFLPLNEIAKANTGPGNLAASNTNSILSHKTPVATPSEILSLADEGQERSYFADEALTSVDVSSDIDETEDTEQDYRVAEVPLSNVSAHQPLKDAAVAIASERNATNRSVPVIHQPEKPGSSKEHSKRSSTGPQGAGQSSRDTADLRESYSAKRAQQTGSDEEARNTLGRLRSKAVLQLKSENSKRGLGVLSQIKNKVLSKDYWMRDENAKDCFYCGDPFSTFRRKHHCRTCGQIFDAKCTVLMSGQAFGQSGTLRVCKPCEGIIHGGDDSSDYSDEGSIAGAQLRPRHGSSGTADLSPARSFTSLRTAYADNRGDMIPPMAIAATRKFRDESGKNVLEIDAEPKIQLARPGSSRSIKSMSGLRSHPSRHRRHHSRSLLQQGIRPPVEDLAPFLRNSAEPANSEAKLPAFHSDNVIDPELADFMSDEESSADEQAGIFATMNGDMSRQIDTDKSATSGFFAGSRKGRSRRGDSKSISGLTGGARDSDTVSLSSVRTRNARLSKRRNFSISSNTHLRPSPRFQRYQAGSPAALAASVAESGNLSPLDHLDSPDGLRITRSSAMKGPDAPAVELNNASIQHVRKLLSQLLEDARVSHESSWEKALMPILLRATDDVTPDVQNGDDIDIRHYIKLKKVPGGRPGDTSYVSGLVFSKNLALKSMPRSISYPNILILTFPLEYSRHNQQFMSLDLLIRQEREYLQNLVHRIAALRPHLLLCQKNIAGLALGFLEKANIATAYNVKPSVLAAVSRCSQTRIINSIDKLAIKPAQAGRCASFYLKTNVYEGKKKTYMYLSGCPKELGCTIVLRGAHPEDLRKLKRITEFMVFVVYNLKLETSFMRDEFALIPGYTGAGTIAPDKEAKTSTEYVEIKRSVAADVKQNKSETGATQNDKGHSPKVSNAGLQKDSSNDFPAKLKPMGTTDSDDIPDDIPMPAFYGDMVERYRDKILSSSPSVRFMQPYLLIRAREQERRLVYLKRLLDQGYHEQNASADSDEGPEKFVLITPDMIHETFEGTSNKVREVLRAAQYAEYDKAVHNYRTQKKQWEGYVSSNEDMFDPFTHQSITVLYSVVCMVTNIPCAGPELLALAFYNEHEANETFEADCTLGQYVEDLCIGANNVCFANGCERRMYEHHRQYVHGSSQLSVTVEPTPAKLRGYQDIILMWSVCRICGNETQVMPMSENTWRYSFGKYLELSLWSHDLHARAGSCSHDLHRNHMRYFGFKSMAVRIQYDSINLLEIIVPRTRITWKVVNDLNFKNEVFSRFEGRINGFMKSVKERIESIRIDGVAPEKVDACKEEIERLRNKADEEHVAQITKLQDKYMGSQYYEIVPLNRAVRATQEKVAGWDQAFAEFDQNFFPSEKDIRRLAALQLKKIFLDRDESGVSLASNEDIAGISLGEKALSEKTSPLDPPTLAPQTRTMSPEKTRDMLTAVVENHSSTKHDELTRSNTLPAPTIIETPQEANLEAAVEAEEVRHLDLALPSTLRDRSMSPRRSKSDGPPLSPTLVGSPLLTPEINTGIETDGKLNLDMSSTPREHVSGIPRPTEGRRRGSGPRSPPLIRTQSQPAHLRRGISSGGAELSIMTGHVSKGSQAKPSGAVSASGKPDKRLSERLGLSALKSSGQSMIPRSIASRRKDTKVSNLAEHFEKLSREFEKERLRDRKQRATGKRQARAYPMKHSKPVIEIYRNVHDAVAERDPSDEDSVETPKQSEDSPSTADQMAQNTLDETRGDGFHPEDTVAGDNTADNTEVDEGQPVDSRAESDTEAEGLKSDDEPSLTDMVGMRESQQILSPSEAQLDLKLDLPKHEKNSLMKTLTNFWAERSASGWQPLEYPLRGADHIFADSDVIIREDEPSSLIAFALDSEDYKEKLLQFQADSEKYPINHNKPYVEDLFLTSDEQQGIERSLLKSKGTHLKYQFSEGSARMLCKIFWPEQFDAVRRKCGVSDRIVECLSRCLKWDSKGGKTKSVFLKTLDDRLILKSLSQIETQAFLKFAPSYFQLMGEALFHELPSVIAKMLGFYQVVIKNTATGVDFNGYVLVMENLFYDRSSRKTFDLKGSMRNRRINSTGEQNEVLLDENMVEYIFKSPLFVREHSKRLMRASLHNDTLFLQKQNVMDYSLMVAIDGDRQELVVGIIDCIRTYTWDKKLESWMKDRGKNRPTVTSPKEYKNRFREAMNRYFLLAPNCWHQFSGRISDQVRLLESGPQTQDDTRTAEDPSNIASELDKNVAIG